MFYNCLVTHLVLKSCFRSFVQNQNSFLLLYYLKSQTFPPQTTSTCWLEIYIDSVTNLVAFDMSLLGECAGFFKFNCSRCFFGFSLSHFTLDFSWFSLERYMKGKSLYSQMFVLPSKACKGSLAWADFFLKSCNYSWKEKKKPFVTNRLLGASCNSLYYSFLHHFLLMR